MTGEPVVATTKDMRAAVICPDAGPWLEARGLSWREFVLRGLPVEALEATGDPRAIRVAAIARERAAHGRG